MSGTAAETDAGMAVQTGRLGRMAVVRLRPNLDLVTAVEDAAREAGFDHALIRSAVGSLVDASLSFGDRTVDHTGPGIEILSLSGEVGPDGARLRGTISKPDQSVHGGEIVRGGNPICITMEIVLQEWLPGA